MKTRAEGWKIDRNALRDMAQRWYITDERFDSLAGDVGDLVRIVERLGNRVFAEKEKAEPVPRFKVGDEVITLCDGAADGTFGIHRGARGTITDSDSWAGHSHVQFEDGRHAFCREDQLELASCAKASAAKVPEPKQKFWPGDRLVCVEIGTSTSRLTKGRFYVAIGVDGKWPTVWNDAGDPREYLSARFRLHARGPNHPKD